MCLCVAYSYLLHACESANGYSVQVHVRAEQDIGWVSGILSALSPALETRSLGEPEASFSLACLPVSIQGPLVPTFNSWDI